MNKRALNHVHTTHHGQASVQKVCTTEEHNGEYSSNKVKSKTDVSLQKVPNGLEQLKVKKKSYYFQLLQYVLISITKSSIKQYHKNRYI